MSMNKEIYRERCTKRIECFAKQDPYKARQSSYARAGRKFSQPCTSLLGKHCTPLNNKSRKRCNPLKSMCFQQWKISKQASKKRIRMNTRCRFKGASLPSLPCLLHRRRGLIFHLQTPKCISVTPLIEIAPQRSLRHPPAMIDLGGG